MMMTLRTSLTRSTPCGAPPGKPLDAVAGRPESPNIPACSMDPGTVTTTAAGVFPAPGEGRSGDRDSVLEDPGVPVTAVALDRIHARRVRPLDDDDPRGLTLV